MNYTRAFHFGTFGVLIIIFNQYDIALCSNSVFPTPAPTVLTKEQETKLLILSQKNKPSPKLRMSVWAKKAGGNIKRNNINMESVDENKAATISKNGSNETILPVVSKPEEAQEINQVQQSSNYYEDTEEESEEECPRKYYRNVRSKLCVPIRCSGTRNRETGECEQEYQGFSRNYYRRPYVYRSPTYRLYRHRGLMYRTYSG